jgi:hypothetical protein
MVSMQSALAIAQAASMLEFVGQGVRKGTGDDEAFEWVVDSEFATQEAGGKLVESRGEAGTLAAELERVRGGGKSPVIVLALEHVLRFIWSIDRQVLVFFVGASTDEAENKAVAVRALKRGSRWEVVPAGTDCVTRMVSVLTATFASAAG